MCFPVCREWKRFNSDELQCPIAMCTCAFPFAGNGNLTVPSVKGWSSAASAHVLSRLQGMETHQGQLRSGVGRSCGAHVLSRLQGMETSPSFLANLFCKVECTCAFPVAGNGNTGEVFPSSVVGVHMCFPGCREWKRFCQNTIFRQCYRAHVLSRLQGMETLRLLRLLKSQRGVHMCFPVCREWKLEP